MLNTTWNCLEKKDIRGTREWVFPETEKWFISWAISSQAQCSISLPAKSHQLKLSWVTSVHTCNILFVSLCLQHNFRAWVWSQEPSQQESSLSSFALCWWLLQYFTGKTRINMMRRTFQMRSGLMSHFLFYALYFFGTVREVDKALQKVFKGSTTLQSKL